MDPRSAPSDGVPGRPLGPPGRRARRVRRAPDRSRLTDNRPSEGGSGSGPEPGGTRPLEQPEAGAGRPGRDHDGIHPDGGRLDGFGPDGFGPGAIGPDGIGTEPISPDRIATEPNCPDRIATEPISPDRIATARIATGGAADRDDSPNGDATGASAAGVAGAASGAAFGGAAARAGAADATGGAAAGAAADTAAKDTAVARLTAATRKVHSAAIVAGRGSARIGRGVATRIRRATHAEGMGETGLSRLIELHAFSMGGDAAMAIGLAGTLFFTVPSGEARGNVALYLLLTMAPFVVVAPLIGPFLDRFRRGRRWAIGSTMAIRAFFCWVLADALVAERWYVYPLVLGCLVASKAYNVTRASAVPRLLPERVALMTANSRISLAGTIGAGVFAAVAGGLAYFGPEWALRWAFLVFVGGTILAIRLPARVDSAEGEESVGMAEMGRNRRRVPAVVVLGLRANAAFRAFSGFLLMFMAFLLQEHPLGGYPPIVQAGIVAGAAGVGAFAGTALGSLVRERLKRPEIVLLILLALATGVATLSAILYGLIAVAVVALAAGLCQQLGKLSLDALIQREVPEDVRTSVFARSETVIQLSWVLGGGLGIILPLIPQLGLGLCAAGLAFALIVAERTRAQLPPSPEASAA